MQVYDILAPLFIILASVWCLKFLWSRKKLYICARKVNGPFALPLIGSALTFLRHPYDIFQTCLEIFAEYPDPIIRVWLGTKLFFVITGPKYVQNVLTNQSSLGKANEYRFLFPILGEGLLISPVQRWKKSRKIIQPAFNQRALDQFVSVFAEYSGVLVEQIKKYCGKKGEDIDLFQIISQCTLDMICETAMGIKVNAQTTNCKFTMWTDRGMKIILKRVFTIFHHSDIIFGMSSEGKELKNISKEVYNFVLDVIKEKKKNYKNRGNQAEEHLGINFLEANQKRRAFLDHIIELSDKEDAPFTDEELIGEVSTFIFGGSDTTATTNCFVLTMLGLYPDIQQRVHDEILDVLGTEKPVEFSDLSNLKYLERVIKETSRLFPAVLCGARAVTADIDLGDYIIPAGSTIAVPFYLIQRVQKYWPNPLKFDPDRFLPDEVAKRHPCTFMSFSYGPRNCIGAKYGIMSMKTLLATVLRKYKINTDYKNLEEIDLQPNIMMRINNGYKVSFEPREHFKT